MIPDANRYGLLVVQAAVLLGARELRIHHKRWLTTFELVGARLARPVLEQLPEFRSAAGPEGTLARAVDLAFLTHAREVRVSCQGRQLRLRGMQRSVLDKGPVDLMLEVDRRPAIVKQMLTSYPHRLEDGPLQEGCRLAPIPISIGGTPLRTRFSLKGCLGALLLEREPDEIGALPVYLPARASLERRESAAPYAAAIGLTSDESLSKTVLVADGVTVDGPRVRGLRAVLWSSALRLDAALTGVVEDALLDQIEEELHSSLRTLNDQLWERLPALTGAQRARAIPYLEELAPGARLAQVKHLLDSREGGPSARLLAVAAGRARAEGDLLEAQSYYIRALDHPEAERSELLPELLQVMHLLRARPRQLEPYVRELFTGLHRKVGKDERMALAGYFEQMGGYSAGHGYPGEARGYYQEALAIQEGLLGKHHPTVEKLRETLDNL